MNSRREQNKSLNLLTIADIYTISVFVIYSLLAIIFFSNLANASELIIKNISILALIFILAYLDKKYEKAIFTLLHRTYFIAIILIIYNQIQDYLPFINPEMYDQTFIKWDKALFGVNPTEWIYKYSHPLLTEYLQIAYFSFYFLPILHAVELYAQKKDQSFYIFSGTILFSFYFSYMLYVVMPAIGPRFIIHEFNAMDQELPGLWLTTFLRDIINSGGAIPKGAANPEQFVNRDCMPSGHTMVTLITIILVYQNNSKFRHLILVLGISLIIATVYLRYHYVVDLIAGILLVYPTLWIESYIRKLLLKTKKIKTGDEQNRNR